MKTMKAVSAAMLLGSLGCGEPAPFQGVETAAETPESVPTPQPPSELSPSGLPEPQASLAANGLPAKDVDDINADDFNADNGWTVEDDPGPGSNDSRRG